MKMAEWGRAPQGQHRARLRWLPCVRHALSVRTRDGLCEGGMRGDTEQRFWKATRGEHTEKCDLLQSCGAGGGEATGAASGLGSAHTLNKLKHN